MTFLRWMVRKLIKPLLEALKEELGWSPVPSNTDDEIKRQLENMSRERLQMLIEDRLAKEVLSLKTEVEVIKTSTEVNAEVQTDLMARIEDVDRKVATIFKVIKVMNRGGEVVFKGGEKKETREVKEVQTSTLEFG